jgi:trimethylamine--corrinoid protein Co-methyltransferase
MDNINPTLPTATFRRLSEDQTNRLLAAALEVLERTGVRLFDEEALALLGRVGVQPTEGNRVRIPAELVERALKTAPDSVTLFDRHGEPAMPVGGHSRFYGPGSDCLYIIDHRTGNRREAQLKDVVEGMQVVDALPHIDFAMCMFLPHDVTQRVADRYQMEAMLANTTKPIWYVTTDLSGCQDAVKMAEVVAGGPQALRERPIAACYVNVTTGLVHNQEALQKLLYLADRGLPFAYVPSTQGGVTAPVTPAGALVVSQAGALAGLVLSQLQREGAPFIMPGWGGNMLDMRTMVQPYADPDKRVLAPDLVHSLNLPMFALAGCSDAKVVDGQAAAEAALTLMTDTLCGANIIHDLGYLESGLTGSLVQLAICNEIVGWLNHFVAPVDLSDEALALDLINEVGPDGTFLESDHTFDHFRERWYPDLFERNNYDGWQAAGELSLAERAVAQVEQILQEHQVESLPEDVTAGLYRIRENAEQALGV